MAEVKNSLEELSYQFEYQNLTTKIVLEDPCLGEVFPLPFFQRILPELTILLEYLDILFVSVQVTG